MPPAVRRRTRYIIDSRSLRNLDTTQKELSVQFNAHRVASVLADFGVQDGAERAGRAVQSQVLARGARRQLRAFLKQAPTPPPSLLPEYSFPEVVQTLLDAGLTPKDVSDVLIHTPGVALMRPKGPSGEGETLEQVLERTFFVLQETLGLRKHEARKVLRQTPGLLTVKGSKNAQSIVDMLQKLGVSTNSMARAALPKLLGRTPEGLFRLIAFLSSDVVRMPLENIGPLLRRPQCQDLLDAVAPIRKIQDEHDPDETDGTDPAVASALWGLETLSRREHIDTVYRNMTRTARTLRNEIGTEDLGKVIAAFPAVLLLDAEEKILPTAEYLMHDLGIWEDDLPNVLQLYPALLGLHIDEMKRIQEYFTELDIDEESISSIFRAFPALLTLTIEADIQPVVDFLTETIGISNVGRFITRLPPVLGYSVSRELTPKWNYLQGIAMDPSYQVSKFPAYFSYPLDRVVKTRYEYLSEVKKIPPTVFNVDQVVSYGDHDFATKVLGEPNDAAFREFSERRRSEWKGQNKRGKKKNASARP